MNATAIKLPDPTMIQGECRECGQIYWLESIKIFEHELAHCVQPTCDACNAAQEKAEAARIAAERRDRIEAEIHSVIPIDLLETNVHHPRFNSELWEAVARWRPSAAQSWLGIVGPADKCKTRCLTLLYLRAMRMGIRCTWTTANRLQDAARDRNSHDNQVAALAREHLQTCLRSPWLFLDDLGKNDWTRSFETVFFQLLDHRKNHRLPLLYSSNAHPEKFALLLSDLNREPIIGRLLDRTTLIKL